MKNHNDESEHVCAKGHSLFLRKRTRSVCAVFERVVHDPNKSATVWPTHPRAWTSKP